MKLFIILGWIALIAAAAVTAVKHFRRPPPLTWRGRFKKCYPSRSPR